MDTSLTSLTDRVLAIRQYPVGSVERQRSLTQIIRTMQRSGKIWRDCRISADQYQEALQQTWVWFCQNIDHYDPTQASLTTWFNCILKYRIKDVLRDVQMHQHHTFNASCVEALDVIDNLPAAPVDQSLQLLAETLAWLEREGDRLQQIIIRNHPRVNAHGLILRRLPMSGQATWEALSAEFGVAIPTLSSFYQRKCLPLLREFGTVQGWIEDAVAA